MTEGADKGATGGTTILTNGDIRLKLCRYGPMFFNIHDLYVGRSLELYGEYSEGECALFGQLLRPGMIALDVGANLGAHTLFMAHKVGEQGRVYAFDPQQVIFQMLCANVTVNNLRNVETRYAAVGATAGTAHIPRPDYARENNLGSVSVSKTHGDPVPMIRIDDLDLPACHFIKVDVEGYERDVLLGAKKTIESFMPVLYVENDRREKSPALLQTILDMGYRAYWHLPMLYNKSNYLNNQENVFGNIVSANVLCVPAREPQTMDGFTEITDADAWCVDDVAGSA